MAWKKYDKQNGSNYSHIYAHNGCSNAKEIIPNFVQKLLPKEIFYRGLSIHSSNGNQVNKFSPLV